MSREKHKMTTIYVPERICSGANMLWDNLIRLIEIIYYSSEYTHDKIRQSYDRQWTPDEFMDIFHMGVMYSLLHSALGLFFLLPLSQLTFFPTNFFAVYFILPHVMIHVIVLCYIGISYVVNKIEWPQIEFKCESKKVEIEV